MDSLTKIVSRLEQASDIYIKGLYASVEKAFKHDAELSNEEKEAFQQFAQDGIYYGTDEFPDWAEWRDALTLEISRRKLEI